jgi:hypothetical protein
MTTELVTARELAELVGPVRAVLKKDKTIRSRRIKLARERTECGLKESLSNTYIRSRVPKQ